MWPEVFDAEAFVKEKFKQTTGTSNTNYTNIMMQSGELSF